MRECAWGYTLPRPRNLELFIPVPFRASHPELPRSVLVCKAGSVPIVSKFGKRRQHGVRFCRRILVIECQHQIPPDFIIKRSTSHPAMSVKLPETNELAPRVAATDAERPIPRDSISCLQNSSGRLAGNSRRNVRRQRRRHSQRLIGLRDNRPVPGREIRKTATKNGAVGIGGDAETEHIVLLLILSPISAVHFAAEQTLWVIRSHTPNHSVSVRVEQ